MKKSIAFRKVATLLLFTLSWQACASFNWSPAPELIGELDLEQVNESSGMAYDEPTGTLFHINDSGDGPHIYLSNLNGTDMKRVSYKAPRPKDVEDLALGPCARGSKERCLFVADMGDNARKREHITLHLFLLSDLTAKANAEAKPYRTLELKYPDRAHDAESLAVDQDGTLYILTKEWSERAKKSYPSLLFKFEVPAQANVSATKFELEEVATLNFTNLIPSAPWWGQTPTAMDLDIKRDLLVVLTYSGVVVLSWEQVKKGALTTSDQVLYQSGPELPQQEALAIVPGGFVYSTEYVKDYGPAALYFWSLD